jgi:DNA-binding CsgD family transcriptional regulator
MTCHLDLPEAKVTAEVRPDGGVFDVIFPVPHSRLAALRASSRAMLGRVALTLGYEDDGVGVVIGDGSFQAAMSGDDRERVRAATERWSLTARQSEVLSFLVRGKANKEIAAALGCAGNTVELHVTTIFRKAGVTSRAELIHRFWSTS